MFGQTQEVPIYWPLATSDGPRQMNFSVALLNQVWSLLSARLAGPPCPCLCFSLARSRDGLTFSLSRPHTGPRPSAVESQLEMSSSCLDVDDLDELVFCWARQVRYAVHVYVRTSYVPVCPKAQAGAVMPRLKPGLCAGGRGGMGRCGRYRCGGVFWRCRTCSRGRRCLAASRRAAAALDCLLFLARALYQERPGSSVVIIGLPTSSPSFLLV